MDNKVKEYLVSNGLAGFADSLKGVDLTDAIDGVSGVVSRLFDMAIPVGGRLRNVLRGGYDKDIKADVEFDAKSMGMASMYHGYQVINAVKIADRRLAGDCRVEVGMKYPTFDLPEFIEKFNVNPVPVVVTLAHGTRYDLYTDAIGNVYTFAEGRAGQGGYAGAIFQNEDEAFKFSDWLLGNRKHYVKDFEIGYNHLGGLGIDEFDAIKDLSFLSK